VRVVGLSESDRRLLATRYREHGNSHRRMRDALREAGATVTVDRLDALRQLERRFDIDLGAVCYRFPRRLDPATHPIERFVVDYVTEPRPEPAGGGLWVRRPDATRAVSSCWIAGRAALRT